MANQRDTQTDLPRFPRPIICAASARALAESAARAGIVVTSYDLFADWDTCECANAIKLNHLSDFATRSDEIGKSKVIFGGGLESNLNDIRELAETLASKSQWGNSSLKSIRASRNPILWTQLLREAGFKVANVRLRLSDDDIQSNWLQKRFDSTAGNGVTTVEQPPAPNKEFFFQRKVAGVPYSSLHVATDSEHRVLGWFRQLIGDSRLSAHPFRYAGSIGPINNSDACDLADQAGQHVSSQIGLRGVFGIDWICEHNAPDSIVPLEINPRITASAELWERATNENIFKIHLNALENRITVAPATRKPDSTHAKVIVYCGKVSISVDSQLQSDLISLRERKKAADIPSLGTTISPEHPFFSWFRDRKRLLDSQSVNAFMETTIAEAIAYRDPSNTNLRHEK